MKVNFILSSPRAVYWINLLFECLFGAGYSPMNFSHPSLSVFLVLTVFVVFKKKAAKRKSCKKVFDPHNVSLRLHIMLALKDTSLTRDNIFTIAF